MRLPNFGMALVALIISMAIWLYVEDQKALIVAKEIKVPLRVLNESESEFVLVGRLPEEVDVTLRGNPDQIDRFVAILRIGDPKPAYVDLSNLREGQTAIRPERWTYPEIASMKIEVEMPDIYIDVEQKAEKRVPVEINPINMSDRYEYRPDKSAIFPETVSVSGARSRVNTVAKVVGTADFSNYKPGVDPNIEVKSLQAQNSVGEPVQEVAIDNNVVLLTPSLSPSIPRVSLVVAPVFEGKPGVGYRVYDFVVRPSPIQATGPTAAKLESIKTRPIRINGLTGNTTRRKVDLVVPQDTKLSQTTVDIEIFIEKIPVIENPAPVNPPNTNATGGTGTTGNAGTTGTPPN